jgi:hypothetical protein
MDNTPNVELINQWLWFAVQIVRIVAWPLVIGLLAWWNRKAILKLVDSLGRRALRLKGPGGIEASLEAITDQAGESGVNKYEATIAAPTPAVVSTPAAGTPASPIGIPTPRPAVAHLEGELRGQLAGVEVTQQNTKLLRELAETRVRAGHEQIYNRIFGTQILAMKNLDLRGTATVADAKQYYDSLIPRFPKMYPAYPFESWLGFIINSGLVSRDGEVLTPTVYGHDFVVYLADNRLSEDKPF